MTTPLYFDRVKESTATSGTGDLTLGGAETGGFQAFGSVLSDQQTCFYCVQDTVNNAWEVGLGTYNASPNTLSRTTVLASSNGGSLVNFAATTKDVFLDLPAGFLAGGLLNVGTGPPPANLGVPNAFYLDLAAGVLYQKS